MNPNSIREYISWLEEFEKIYKEYIESDENLEEIFTVTLENFKKILSGNNKNKSEEDIIKLLIELVKKFSIKYKNNVNKNKSLVGPRKIHLFKQNIYDTEIAKLKESLIKNIDDSDIFSDFESIVMFVAKKRQMIEFLKLGFLQGATPEYNKYFDIFGKKRVIGNTMRTPLFGSHAKHLFKELIEKKVVQIFHKYNYLEETIALTQYSGFRGEPPRWYHTDPIHHPKLFQIMNELYSKFLSNHNISDKQDILAELYWLYMQTCPFTRGSASIGEILFSVLLRKHFNCDFFISDGWNGNPEIIPDIYALTYVLDHFKSIFFDKFTNCTGKTCPTRLKNKNDSDSDN